MPQVPFPYRIAALLLFSLAAVLFDSRRPRPERSRHVEYGFLLLSTFLAALAGAVIDNVTMTISPDYFVHGKGLDPGPRLRWRVTWLGLQAGASVGVVAATVLLVANRRPTDALRLIRHVGPLVGSAILGGLLAGLVEWWLDLLEPPHHFRFLGPARSRWFAVVWATHMGIYAGAILGLIAAVRRVRHPD